MAEKAEEVFCGFATAWRSWQYLYTNESSESNKTEINFGGFGRATVPGYIWKILQTPGSDAKESKTFSSSGC